MTEKIRPVGYIVDWPDEPDLGAYFSEEPNDSARSRALYTEDDVRELLRRERERCAEVCEGREHDRKWVPGSLYDVLRRESAAAIRALPDTEVE